MADLSDEIGKLRAQLLDMGKNNNLVNYQYHDERSIRIVDMKPEALFTKLVSEGKGLRIISSKAVNIGEDDLKGSPSQSDIDKRLEYLIKRYHEDYDDLGHTTVYVAVGFLSWRTNTNNKAPIVLLPAELKRDVAGNIYVYWNGEDIRVSPTFIEKLKELNIRIPEQDVIEDTAGLERCFAMMNDAIDGRTGFKVSSTIVVDLFDYSKSVMYNDLEPSSWSDVPDLVKRILTHAPNGKGSEKDKRIPSCTYSILDGDASQMSVIMDVLVGRSVVVEGPPGTGKSQTISNIISEAVGNGKTVLFVSEKMAALNVVKRRLDEAGLSTYVLELHSENMNRKNFLREMERSMSREVFAETVSDQDCVRLERIRGDLDGYAEAISAPVGERGFTPYQLIGMREVSSGNIRRRKRVPVRVDIEEPLTINDDKWDECIDLLRTASELIPAVTPIKKNPWKDCNIHDLTPDKEYVLKDHIFNIGKRLDDIQTSAKDVCKILGISPPHTLGDLNTLDKECKNLLRLGSISLKDAMEGDAQEYTEAADAVIASLSKIQELKASLLKHYRQGILSFDAAGVRSEFVKSKGTVFKKTYKEIKKKFESHSVSASLSDDTLEKDFDSLVQYQNELAGFDQGDSKHLFGERWNGLDSKIDVLKSVRDWMASVKKNVSEGRYSDKTALVISRGGGPELEATYKELGSNISGLFRSLDSVMDILGMDLEDVFEKGYDDVKPAAVRKWLKDLVGNLDSLRPWANYCEMMEHFAATPINDMGKKIVSGDINPLDIMDTFLLGYSSAVMAKAVETRPPLRDFSSELHELWLKDFMQLDTSLLRTNCERLRKKLIPMTEKKMAEEDDGIRILKGEFNRGKGQMSVRNIVNKAGSAIQAVKPCFMMSPMSVAQYLGKDMLFDIVIFDEASQVLPADSLGALMRGRQAVIMGDSKQLPPTVFFSKREEGSTEEATPTDMESLLNLCKASLRVHVLSWHYRSRHSSLMALSNRLFYDDRLMVCPSPAPATEDNGLKLRYVRSAVYERGLSGTNPKEAKMIARAVWHHFIDVPEKSLGVATFNVNQQRAITDEVEKMFKRHPDARANMMKNVTEPFIIRNLESVQGDERDVMFISIGYGYDTDGKLSKNYGALNRAGGERRLNVLMTRAREKCVIFSNFRSMDMGMMENAPEGVSALQAYLEYAELGHTSKLDSPQVKDDLGDSISAFLASKGIRTERNVGSSGFRIDVAVCSPSDPSTFLLGICLDGRTYQNMRYTRDRDRTFISLLQQMGWNTHRIWSMDWYVNPELTKKKLWSKVTGALARINEKSEVDPEMFDLVSGFAEAESPIHRAALEVRIRKAKEVPSVSVKLRRSIDDAVNTGKTLGRFIETDNFLIIPGRPILPRTRSSDETMRPEWVHPEEYARALKESMSAELSEDQMVDSALKKLGLPLRKNFKDEARSYLGME